MKFKYFILSLFLFTSLCLSQTLYENAGTSSNLFLRLGVSPRASGMGGTFTAIANDENTILYNTAGLAKPLFSGIALNHIQWFEDIRIENLLFNYKMGGGLGLGIGISQGRDTGVPLSLLSTVTDAEPFPFLRRIFP